MEHEIHFQRVVDVWRAADEAAGRNTLGILLAFQPPRTTRWIEEEIHVSEIGGFRFIGGVSGDRYEQVTGGTYRVGDSTRSAATNSGFRWDSSWRLIAVRDPENGRRVLIDGNGRALMLQGAVQSGTVGARTTVGLMTGDLAQGVVFLSKAIAPLWR